MEKRGEKVKKFWETGLLDPNSNVQFGEGGAGTFSDGKLNTLVKDPKKRNQRVLETLVQFGADEEILYENKPHIGTDVLSGVVKNMREEIIRLGGEVLFGSQVTDISVESGKIAGVCVNENEWINTKNVVLAIGHSARDTFQMLWEKQVPMEAKPFAVGIRIQHKQSVINTSQYGKSNVEQLGAASYKLTNQTSSGRGVYSFCMCPGGYVVNASSEEGMLAVNGMSYHDRSGNNANSAIIVTISPDEFSQKSPLAGVEFQRELEKKAFASAHGSIPIQRYGDYKVDRMTHELGSVLPEVKGAWAYGDIRKLFSEELNEAIIESMEVFGRKIKGFSDGDALLCGVESRTSSPIKIWREEDFQSPIKGLYPCGEGAGYAGGITSAAMDGIKVAEAIALTFS